MKSKKRIIAALVCGIMLTALCTAGCSKGESTPADSSKASAASETTAPESRTAESSSEESKTESSRAESSKQESSMSEKEKNTEQAKKDIKLLLEYKKNIPESADYTLKSGNRGYKEAGDKKGTAYYVDSVIRDVNDDGKMEMIVKYSCILEHSGCSPEQFRCTLYDLVAVVDGKAVATRHFEDESWFMYTEK